MARNNPARKFLEFILAKAGLVRKKSKFSSPGPVVSRQNVQILTIMYKFLAKMLQNEPIPCHGENKVKIFFDGAPLARQNLVFRPEEFSP